MGTTRPTRSARWPTCSGRPAKTSDPGGTRRRGPPEPSGGGMEIRRGIAVTPGVAIGPALVLDTEGVIISQRTVPAEQAEAEVRRLDDALARAAADARD